MDYSEANSGSFPCENELWNGIYKEGGKNSWIAESENCILQQNL